MKTYSIISLGLILLASNSQAALIATNSNIAPTGYVPSNIMAGVNTINGVTFTNLGAALQTMPSIPGNATTTFDFFSTAAAGSSPGVSAFTLELNDVHDGGGLSTLTITATTQSGDSLVFTSAEGSGNPSIGFSTTATFQPTTSLNGATPVNTSSTVTQGEATSAFFTFTADSASNPIVSASFTWASPDGNDGIFFQGISVTPTPIPEPSVAILGCLGFLGIMRRRR